MKIESVIVIIFIVIYITFVGFVINGVSSETKRFYISPNKFIELTLKDNNLIYINSSSIESITQKDEYTEVRTISNVYTVKEHNIRIKEILVERL